MKALFVGLALFLVSCGEAPDTQKSSWKSDYVTANGIRIHYWRTGDGKPVIVAAHGLGDSGRCWTSFARELESSYDLVMYDARGHGLSDKPESGYEIDNQVEDLAALVRALELETPILMGHSMGGAIAAITAARYPDIPRAVILEDPAYVSGGPDQNWENIRGPFQKWIEEKQSKSKEELIAEVAKEFPHWPESDREPWAESKLQMSPRVFDGLNGFPNLEDVFSNIEAPTLVLKADSEGDRRAREAYAGTKLPNGKLVHVRGAGHNIRRDEPKEMLKQVRMFLDDVMR